MYIIAVISRNEKLITGLSESLGENYQVMPIMDIQSGVFDCLVLDCIHIREGCTLLSTLLFAMQAINNDRPCCIISSTREYADIIRNLTPRIRVASGETTYLQRESVRSSS